MSAEQHHPESPSGTPLSLNQLKAAFAEMLGENPNAVPADLSTEQSSLQSVQEDRPPDEPDDHQPCDVTPRSIVEAILFLGHPENRPITACQMAAAMRDVSPKEVVESVGQLNNLYREDGAPYEIIQAEAGYRLALRDEYTRMRDKLYGKVREARLSQTSIEVLSIVAYNQPTTLEQIDALRGSPSRSALATLVRRKLVRLERPQDKQQSTVYRTTDRFLKVFGMSRPEELPRVAECENA